MIGNYKIDEILCKWCKEAGTDHHLIYYDIANHTRKCELNIYYPFPGYLIGKAGMYIDKYKPELEKQLNKKVKINFIEVRTPMSPEEWTEYCISRGF